MANTEAQKQAQRRYRERNRDQIRDKARAKATETRADPEKRAVYNEYMREWRAAHPDDGRRRSREFRERNPTYRVKLHGLTPTEFARMAEAQDGKCAICQEVPQGQRLRVDHDHRCCDSKFSCGKCIRGLLCSQCNAALGGFRDEPRLLEAAVRYLNG